MAVDSETPVGAHPASAASAVATPDAAGRLLARLTALPALVALSFLLVAFPLLLLGWFKPAPVLLLAVAAAAVIVPVGWRAIKGYAGDQVGARPGRQASRTPWWAVAALVAIAAGFGIDQALFHSQFVIVTRDPASYLQFATWIERHGSLPITQSTAPFGGRGTGGSTLHFASWAFYQVGDDIVPQFMAGLPMVLSVGFWAGGVNAAFLMAPLLGAAAVLTFGGLVARLVGARWAPPAALALALSLPEQFTSRSTYSETLSQILLVGGLCLLIDALRAGGGRAGWLSAARVLAALAGLCLGINFLVRLDGPSDMLPLIPLCGYLLLRRRPQAFPLMAGFVAGLVYGAVDGWFLSRPYLGVNGTAVKQMTMAFAAALVVTAVAVILLRRRGVPRAPRWFVRVATALPFVVMVAFAVRPLVQTDYRKLQDAPLSLHWVYWYAGAPVIAAATIAAALLARRCLRGEAPDWLAPLLVFFWTTVVFLYKPGITPDQPWGSRRLVPAVLPGFILLATWLAAWLTQRARGLQPDSVAKWATAPGPAATGRRMIAPVLAALARAPRATAAVLAVCCVLGLAVPAAKTTYNLRLHYVGGLRLTADGWASYRMYQGESTAVQRLCAALPPDSSVLFVNTWNSDGLEEAVRGTCGVPVASLMPVNPNSKNPKSANVKAVIRRIEATGRRPVLLAKYRHELNPYPNGTVRKVMTLKTREDQHAMNRPPTGAWTQKWDVWMWEAK